eukprot:scaffold44039_cov161-Skeletonema_marinoi.AAC.2
MLVFLAFWILEIGAACCPYDSPMTPIQPISPFHCLPKTDWRHFGTLIRCLHANFVALSSEPKQPDSTITIH